MGHETVAQGDAIALSVTELAGRDVLRVRLRLAPSEGKDWTDWLKVTIARLIDQSRGHRVALRQRAVIHPFRGGAPIDVLTLNPGIKGKMAKPEV